MTKKCRVAMIGAGGMAREHLRAFADLDNVEFAGITSRTRSKAEKLAEEFGIPAVVEDIAELAALKPNLAVVAASADQMDKVVRACCDYPWTILAEKPVGLNLEQSRQTLEYARQKNSRVFVALNRRFYESTRKMKAALEKCAGPRFIEVFDQQEPEKLRRIRGHADEIGLMFGNSIHTIDYLTHLGRGDIVSVETPLPWNTGVPLAVCAVIKYSSGDTAVYHGLWNAPGPWAVNVTTAQERWELRPLEKAWYQKAGERTLHEVALNETGTKFKAGLRLQASEAVEIALERQGKCPALADVHRTMCLINKIYGNIRDVI